MLKKSLRLKTNLLRKVRGFGPSLSKPEDPAMDKLDLFCNALIQGKRGEWYFDLKLGKEQLARGLFTTKCNARRALRSHLSEYIRSKSILIEYLEFKFGPAK